MPVSPLHPEVRAYLEASITDALAEGIGRLQAYTELEGTLRAAVEAGDLPDLPDLVRQAHFNALWRSQACAPAAPYFLPLAVASVRTFELSKDERRIFVTLVVDADTECLTGLAVHSARDDERAAVQALDRAIARKHARDRRRRGCRHAWLCEGKPDALDVGLEWDYPSSALLAHADVLGIDRAKACADIDWGGLRHVLGRAVRWVPIAPSPTELLELERVLECAAVDDWNQQEDPNALTPHRKWLLGMRTRSPRPRL